MSINELELINDVEMEVNFDKDADDIPAPPPEATYKVTSEFKEPDPEKRWKLKFAIKEDGRETNYDVVKWDGRRSDPITVRETNKKEDEAGTFDFDYPSSPEVGQLYYETNLVSTLVDVRPEKDGTSVPPELWESRKVFAKLSTKLTKNKTTTATDFIKAHLTLDEAKQATSGKKVLELVTAIVAGGLDGWMKLRWKAQNLKTPSDEWLSFNQLPTGMKSFNKLTDSAGKPVLDVNGKPLYDPELERTIDGVSYLFRAQSDVQFWIPRRSTTAEGGE